MFQKGITGVLLAVFLNCAVATVSMGQNVSVPRAVVLTGQTAPGADGALFKGLGRPSINSSGGVAFRADLTGTAASYGAFVGKLTPSGIFVAASGSISRIVGYGDAVPNATSTFTKFGDPALNDSGQVAFVGTIGNGFEHQGVFLQTSGGLVSIALSGGTAPGTGGNFAKFGQYGLALNNAGTAVFEATFNGSGSGDGIFVYSNGTLRPAVLEGQAVPGGQGDTFVHFSGLAVNEVGEIAFTALLDSGIGPVATGVFLISGNRVSALARTGQEAPYLDGGNFGTLGQPSINDAGAVAFVDAISVQARFTNTIPHGLFVTALGATSAVTRAKHAQHERDPVLSGNFQQPGTVLGSGRTNTILFVARSQATGQNGLWRYSNGALTPLLQEGDTAPIGGVHSFIGNLAVSSSGHFAFVSNLKGSSARAGIFANQINF